MSLIDTLPQVVVILFNTLILRIQDRKDDDLGSGESDSDIPDFSSRFSTLKREVINTEFTLIQTCSFAFLFGWRFSQKQEINPVLSAGLLAIFWFYAFVLSTITIYTRSRTFAWIINCHLSIIYTVSSICSLFRFRNIFKDTYYFTLSIESVITIGDLIVSTLLAFIVFTTPKGPKLYYKGRLIFANSYCSFWAFLTYSTITPLLKKAHKFEQLNDSDLDQLGYSLRATALYKKFERWRGRKLLFRIWKANQYEIIIQIILALIIPFLYYLPMILFYYLLEFIQKKSPDDSLGWVYGQNRYWSAVVLPCNIRGMLNSEIYYKSLKRFDSHTSTNEKEDDQAREDNTKDNLEKDKATIGKITNLMTVDTNRICVAMNVWNDIIECPMELIVGFYLLYQLLGLACFIGLLVLCVTFPINHQTAKIYTKTQDKLMKTRDHRINLMHETLQGIRMIKFFAWDKKYEDRVLEARAKELIQLRNNFICRAIFDLLWMSSPILVTIFSFFVFTEIQGNYLTVSIAFTSISIFNELQFAFNALPEMIMTCVQAFVSLGRIEEFLDEEEINLSLDVDYNDYINSKIAFEDATITWNKKIDENEFIMKDLNIEFPVGELSIICGPTGSGKSMLLMSLLKETYLVKGIIHCPRSPTNPINKDLTSKNWILHNGVALVSQQAWLLNATIRENILFGLPLDEQRYSQVITMTTLDKDLEIFQDGDLTEIGEKGITLSGGQKQRVALARAIYSRAKHVFMDDILSAVDAHTARYIMNNCILGPLMKGRTRILVTHHVRLCLTGATYLVVVRSGKISVNSTISELRDSGKLNLILDDEVSHLDINNFPELLDDTINQENNSKAASHQPEFTASTGTIFDESNNDILLIKKNSKPRKLVQEESRPTGMVRFKVYMTYLRANGNILFWLFALTLFISARSAQVLGSWWLKEWANASTEEPRYNYKDTFSTLIFYIKSRKLIYDNLLKFINGHDVSYYFNIYVLITSSSIFLGVARFIWLYYGSLRASKILYQSLLHRVIRAPLRFFDTTPVGRILNRFGKDFETIDINISGNLGWFLNNIFMVIGTTLVITFITKEFFIMAILMGIYYLWVGKWFADASRELKRLVSVTRSPVYSHFTETLIGIITIRAYGATRRFMQEMITRIDDNNRPAFYYMLIRRWLSVRYDFAGVFVTFIVGVLILWNLDYIDAGLAGLSLSFAMQFTHQIMWYVRKYASLETSLNAVERVNEFSEISQEPPGIIEPRPPASWPYEGAISVENLSVRYAHDLELVLQNVSFSVKGHEKVGIVGRTGSGKSTLALALFRFMEESEGKIYIDGIDISTIGVYDIRSRITIIPQDPILFTGTLRSNLDVFSTYQDHEILESLRRVHLLPSDEIVQNDPSLEDNIKIFSNLETPVSEGGKNFSQGQRQLLCLARALLRRSKIIIMDEATASIDFAMDENIQKMIRAEFEDCTVLCIAHRLRTVIDYDRILVMNQGKIVEFDSPKNLIINSESLFHKLCQNSGEYDMLKLLALNNKEQVN
ncbi:P-loop containing nucleoside triphosphate hydrolase protein [Rhizophagus irregularis]|uniref:P-loop containing nucleoside triphosphate hydrolase protein n=1 Tax=Rhizophagus irregularis TaxID=588596 RepID=A0A2N0RSN3_9GLOM|nr:P-loop containing nucleoside triphosphate hydrolase protein [Rhizophagus irregularis]CAB4491465.1 unnamed protein product [Rhizophagus irregularis]